MLGSLVYVGLYFYNSYNAFKKLDEERLEELKGKTEGNKKNSTNQ